MTADQIIFRFLCDDRLLSSSITIRNNFKLSFYTYLFIYIYVEELFRNNRVVVEIYVSSVTSKYWLPILERWEKAAYLHIILHIILHGLLSRNNSILPSISFGKTDTSFSFEWN